MPPYFILEHEFAMTKIAHFDGTRKRPISGTMDGRMSGYLLDRRSALGTGS